MKVLVIQQRMGIGDMVIFLSYIHAISKSEKCPVSLLVKKSSRAKEFLNQDKHIDKIIFLDREKNKSGHHDGLPGFFNLVKELKSEQFEKVYIFNSSLRYNLLARFVGIKNIYQYPLFEKKGQNIVETAKIYNVHLPLSKKIEKLYDLIVKEGKSNLDHSALYLLIKRLKK